MIGSGILEGRAFMTIMTLQYVHIYFSFTVEFVQCRSRVSQEAEFVCT